MFSSMVKKVFGSRNERVIRRLKKNVVIINSLEAEFLGLSNEELQAKTGLF